LFFDYDTFIFMKNRFLSLSFLSLPLNRQISAETSVKPVFSWKVSFIKASIRCLKKLLIRFYRQLAQAQFSGVKLTQTFSLRHIPLSSYSLLIRDNSNFLFLCTYATARSSFIRWLRHGKNHFIFAGMNK
jgi:hypothetical protein